MLFNLNYNVKVKLTVEGVKILEEYHKRQNLKMQEMMKARYEPFTLPEVDKEGYSTFRACELFEIFGGRSWLCIEPFNMYVEFAEDGFSEKD